MNKQEVIDSLKKTINSIENDSDSTEYDLDIRIMEKPKCPKCGTYEGEGYTYINFLYSVSECTVCGYSKKEF